MVRLELDTALSVHALGSSIDEIPFHCSRVIIHGGFRFSLPIKQQRMAVMVIKVYVTSRGTSNVPTVIGRVTCTGSTLRMN
jgi:hypothetical protein